MSNLRASVWITALISIAARAQTVPVSDYRANGATYSIVGKDPAAGDTTTIPVLILPVHLRFASHNGAALDPSASVQQLLRSPVFTASRFPSENVQYLDAMLRASLPHADTWHTVLHPQVLPAVTITVPLDQGYLLTSKRGGSLGIADIQFVQQKLFDAMPKHPGALVLALTANTAFYVERDATICCTWGTHGTDRQTGNSFVLATYLDQAPAVVQDRDVQPITEQLAEFANDPLHDPLAPTEGGDAGGNKFPPWVRPASMHTGDYGPCGGTGVATPYFLLEPTDVNRKNDLPYSKPFTMSTYHVQNVALLSWYTGQGSRFSFPDSTVLAEAAKPCTSRETPPEPQQPAKPQPSHQRAHSLIGYWTGSDRGQTLALDAVAPQWDVVIVAFAVPDHSAAEGTLRFRPPEGTTPDQFKAAIAKLHQQGRKVLISLGGGGELFSLDNAASIPVFVSCVNQIVREYGFDGIDLDFETPSFVLAPGDTDFRHPTTPGIVHLITALRQMKDQLGPKFLITLVPEGPQFVAGHVTYGGQFGSYLPIAYGIRDILTFVDVQDYNTPPLEGLDGEIYQAGSVDYHAAMTDLVLNGFRVGGQSFEYPAIPQKNTAVGFFVEETDVPTVAASMRYLILGEKPSEASYVLRNPRAYPGMIGAMFWNIDEDRSHGYNFSNVIGPLLHEMR